MWFIIIVYKQQPADSSETVESVQPAAAGGTQQRQKTLFSSSSHRQNGVVLCSRGGDRVSKDKNEKNCTLQKQNNISEEQNWKTYEGKRKSVKFTLL